MSSSFRVIEGGRTGEPTPGFLVVGASEVVTLEGGVRRGPEQGEVGRLLADDPAGPDAPSVAGWEGRIVAVGPRAAVEAALEAEGLPLGRFARIDAAGGAVTPGLVDPHTHLVFAGSARGRARPASAGRLVPRHPGGRRRDPVHRRRDARRLGGRAARPRTPLAR